MSKITKQVKEYLKNKPFLQEALRLEIINYSALAELIKKDLDPKIKSTSVIMALRRYQENLSKITKKKINYGPNAEANLKTNLHMFTVTKSNTIFSRVDKIRRIIDFKSGGVLHTVQGNYQMAIITNSGYADKVRDMLEDEEIIREDKNLVSIALKYSDELIDLPGNLFLLTKALAWENITIIDLIETMSESIFLIKEKDATKALSKLNEVMKKNK